jgi:NAD-dependent deacetylase
MLSDEAGRDEWTATEGATVSGLEGMDRHLDALLARGAEVVRASRRIVAFTGAGVSTPSGIPDFRSPGSGLWEHDDPSVVASLSYFRRDPQPFFDWIRPLARQARIASPNPAHYALADLESAGRLTALVTQNIDGLHQAAGSRRVLEIHGSLRTATCQSCGKAADGLAALAADHQSVPCCDCGGVLKPDIVFFEERLPLDVFAEAERALRDCDLVIVAGSSLEVMPAGHLPLVAVRRGARLIIVNRDRTTLDRAADVVLSGDVATLLPDLAASVTQG